MDKFAAKDDFARTLSMVALVLLAGVLDLSFAANTGSKRARTANTLRRKGGE